MDDIVGASRLLRSNAVGPADFQNVGRVKHACSSDPDGNPCALEQLGQPNMARPERVALPAAVSSLEAQLPVAVLIQDRKNRADGGAGRRPPALS